jgi:hypothetical protein
MIKSNTIPSRSVAHRGARYAGVGRVARSRAYEGHVEVTRMIDHKSGFTKGRTTSPNAAMNASRSKADKIRRAARYFSGRVTSVMLVAWFWDLTTCETGDSAVDAIQ